MTLTVRMHENQENINQDNEYDVFESPKTKSNIKVWLAIILVTIIGMSGCVYYFAPVYG